MHRVVLTREDITPALRAALELPRGAWQLVFNKTLTTASYIDAECRVHHLDLGELKRQAVQTALQSS